MNYRHAFHAGNFADVVKHALLTRIVEHLKKKEKAFRVIDTHAGSGLYDLTSNAAQRSPEWRDGIARLMDAPPGGNAGELLKPYLDVIASFNAPDRLQTYPGSPMIVRRLMRGQDRLTAIELHPADANSLSARLKGDFQARVIQLDGWLALGAHVPPKEKRGLVLVDPPFEAEGEFERIADGLAKAYRRWPGGIYAFWYPVKDRSAISRLRALLMKTEIPKILDLDVSIRAPSSEPSLDGTGMIVVNPPFGLEEECRILLPALAKCLARDTKAFARIERLAGERLSP